MPGRSWCGLSLGCSSANLWHASWLDAATWVSFLHFLGLTFLFRGVYGCSLLNLGLHLCYNYKIHTHAHTHAARGHVAGNPHQRYQQRPLSRSGCQPTLSHRMQDLKHTIYSIYREHTTSFRTLWHNLLIHSAPWKAPSSRTETGKGKQFPFPFACGNLFSRSLTIALSL